MERIKTTSPGCWSLLLSAEERCKVIGSLSHLQYVWVCFFFLNLFGVNGAVQVDFVVLLFLFVNMRLLDTRSVRVRELDGKMKHSSLGQNQWVSMFAIGLMVGGVARSETDYGCIPIPTLP